MKSRLVSLFVGLLMAAVAVFGTVLAPEGAQAASVKRLTFASAGFHESNRSWTVSRPDHLQFEPFWETLIGLDPKTSDPIPALATKWEHSPDYKEWTFHLRKGVQFHYGYGEFTSADVVHSHSLVVRKDSTSTLRPFWATVEEVKPVDKHTVVFRFKNPVLPSSMVFGASRSGDLRMASKAQWDKEGVEGYDKRPAGTGPFMYRGGRPASTSCTGEMTSTGPATRWNSRSSSSASPAKKQRVSPCCSPATSTSPTCRASCTRTRSPRG